MRLRLICQWWKNDILKEFNDIFNGRGNIIKEYTIKLRELIGGVSTSKLPLRVPIKIKEKLKQKIDWLYSLDIISKVDTPINGSVD